MNKEPKIPLVNQNLGKIRKASNLSDHDFCKKVGIPWQKWEHMERFKFEAHLEYQKAAIDAFDLDRKIMYEISFNPNLDFKMIAGMLTPIYP